MTSPSSTDISETHSEESVKQFILLIDNNKDNTNQ